MQPQIDLLAHVGARCRAYRRRSVDRGSTFESATGGPVGPLYVEIPSLFLLRSTKRGWERSLTSNYLTRSE
jgi:hypothetical protein